MVKVGGESLMVYYEYMKQSKKDLKSCDDFIDVVDKSVLARYVDNIENPELIRKIIKYCVKSNLKCPNSFYECLKVRDLLCEVLLECFAKILKKNDKKLAKFVVGLEKVGKIEAEFLVGYNYPTFGSEFELFIEFLSNVPAQVFRKRDVEKIQVVLMILENIVQNGKLRQINLLFLKEKAEKSTIFFHPKILIHLIETAVAGDGTEEIVEIGTR